PVERLTYQARSITEPFGTMMIDEPRDRGGHEQGPSPLSYFLIGAGACQLNQFIRLGIAREVDIHFRQVQTKGEWHRKAGGGFQHITQEFYAEGAASVNEVEGLVEEAQRFCPVHITLSKAVKITLVVHLNGTEVVRSVTNPTE
ncbi:OsmC family protein, partial [Dehalococcoidia bacterium]|nr:OsmC family protein [Dehalococcoidia bacterium]